MTKLDCPNLEDDICLPPYGCKLSGVGDCTCDALCCDNSDCEPGTCDGLGLARKCVFAALSPA
jgi:hypothetical protein